MGPSGITLELCCLQKYFISHGNFKKLFVFNIKTLPPPPQPVPLCQKQQTKHVSKKYLMNSSGVQNQEEVSQ